MPELRKFKHGVMWNIDNQIVDRRLNQHEMAMKSYIETCCLPIQEKKLS